jgi:hypothetical protein
MNKYSLFHLFLLMPLLLLYSCSSDPVVIKENVLSAADSMALLQSKTDSVAAAKYDMVISDIPFPFEILDNLYSKHVLFNQKAMNDFTSINKYNQYNSKALNLGIYGADLAYCVTYEEFQPMGAYVKTTKRLAEELNIPYAFDQTMMDKYSKFKDNKDSLTKVVYDSYNQVDKSLKGDERVGLAALVVTGSWLEGLYLSTKTFLDAPKTAENASMYEVITEQKKSLIIVVKLLDEYKKDENIAKIMDELKTISMEYNTLSSDITMNEKQLIAIHSKVSALRNKIIEGQ